MFRRTERMTICGVLAVTFVLGMALGCDSDPAPPEYNWENVRALTVGDTGITIYDPVGSRLEGIEITSGSVEPIRYTSADGIEHEIPLENVLVMEPDGATFDPPLIVSLPDAPGDEPRIIVSWTEDSQTWTTVPTFDFDFGTYAQVEHFSSIASIALDALQTFLEVNPLVPGFSEAALLLECARSDYFGQCVAVHLALQALESFVFCADPCIRLVVLRAHDVASNILGTIAFDLPPAPVVSGDPPASGIHTPSEEEARRAAALASITPRQLAEAIQEADPSPGECRQAQTCCVRGSRNQLGICNEGTLEILDCGDDYCNVEARHNPSCYYRRSMTTIPEEFYCTTASTDGGVELTPIDLPTTTYWQICISGGTRCIADLVMNITDPWSFAGPYTLVDACGGGPCAPTDITGVFTSDGVAFGMSFSVPGSFTFSGTFSDDLQRATTDEGWVARRRADPPPTTCSPECDVGSPCDEHRDCVFVTDNTNPRGAYCLTDWPTTWPDGSCVVTNVDSIYDCESHGGIRCWSSCPPGMSCSEWGFCVQSCTGDTDCRPGYRCGNPLTVGFNRCPASTDICVPI